MTENDTPRAQLPPAFRIICLFNALVWVIARPPWFQSDAVSVASALAGAGMWTLLGLWGNREGWPRHATLFFAGGYAGMLAARLAMEKWIGT